MVVALPLDTAMLLTGFAVFGVGMVFGFLVAKAMK